MAHQVGDTELPLGSQDNESAPGAPWLGVLADSFAAGIRKQCLEAWVSISRSDADVIHGVFPRPTGECRLRPQDFPALFVWSQRQPGRQRIAEGILVRGAEVRVMWVPPPGQVAHVQERHPFWDVIGATIALYTGAEIASPDTTNFAWGELIVDKAGLWDLSFQTGEVTTVAIQAGANTEQTLAYEWQLQALIRIAEDPIAEGPVATACSRITYKGGTEANLDLLESHLESQ